MIVGVIVVCEIGFWLLVVLGLAARYILRRPRAGAALLLLTPVDDVVLLLAVAIDLSAGGTATFAHALAAIYLGFSLVYGHRMIRWADMRFAHRYAGGPAPEKLHGLAYTRACWLDVLRTTAAVAIAAAVLWLLTVLAADPTATSALTGTSAVLGAILAIELLWAVSYTVWPKGAPREREPRARGQRRSGLLSDHTG